MVFLDRYYGVDSGDLWTNRYVEFNGNWYYLGNDGKPVTGTALTDKFSSIVIMVSKSRVTLGYYSKRLPIGNYRSGQTGDKVTFTKVLFNVKTAWFYLDDKG